MVQDQDEHGDGLTAERLLDAMTPAERARAERVESVLPALRDAAVEADRLAEFPLQHVATLSGAGLLGLVVPEEYGGLGGGLRDLAAATFAMGTACPSTALAYFFQCSSASRGLLPLEAIDAGLFTDDEVPVVRAFAEKVLYRLGKEGRWMANFASESAKSSSAAITISTRAEPATRDGVDGWVLNGVKSFGCATGVADDYLVSAMFPGGDTAEHLGTFIVARDAPGVRERARWDAIGMRASATHGIVLEDVFVPAEDALALPGSFLRMTRMSRGSFVGSQLAGTAVYLGAAAAVHDFALDHLRSTTFVDTGAPIGTAPFQQQLVGQMAMHLRTATLWLQRQIELETADPPLATKDEVVAQWRIAKGTIAEEAFAVATCAMKACGTSNTGNSGMVARSLRDLSMGLVQAFPAERGRLEAASMIVTGGAQASFGGART
jgi:alkylation response protein AidB-like acyl-CoA dehydrogenase